MARAGSSRTTASGRGAILDCVLTLIASFRRTRVTGLQARDLEYDVHGLAHGDIGIEGKPTIVAVVGADTIEQPASRRGRVSIAGSRGEGQVKRRDFLSDRAHKAERLAGIWVDGQAGQNRWHKGVETIGKLAVVPELPHPDCQNLHKRPPRNLILIDGDDVSRGMRNKHHCGSRCHLGVLNLWVNLAASLPRLAHRLLNQSLGIEPIDAPDADSFPRGRHCIEQERGERLVASWECRSCRSASRGVCR